MPDRLLANGLNEESVRNPDHPDSALSQSGTIGVQRIVLTGFMGAGKSTVGKLLAQRLNWQFVDADDAIQAAAGATIAEIFSQNGEPWFRELEHQTIRHLATEDQIVLALGGGAIEDARSRNLLRNSPGTSLIHLEATLETGLSRCQGTESTRPVLAQALSDRAALESRYLRRLPLYREAHYSIPVDALLPEAVVEAVLDALQIGSETAL
jgi:shikimate kinase